MNSTNHTQSDQAVPPSLPSPSAKFWHDLRARWRRLAGNRIFPLATFLIGLLLGITGLLFYAFLIAHDALPDSVTTVSSGVIVVQVSPDYIAELAQQNLRAAGMPGTVQDVQASMTQNGPLTLTGEDRFTVLGVSVTRRFTVLLQPYVKDCQLQVHILHADLNGIVVTGLTTNFEKQINRELQVKMSQLPQGFTYCTVGVRTNPQALSIIYSAVPNADSTAMTSRKNREL